MSARSESFPWPSHYGHYNFFEERISRHGKVKSLTARGGGVYDLTRKAGDTLHIFICECYAFGIAEYMESVGRLGRLDAVIINSSWCGYTTEIKRDCRKEKVGLFTIGEFMAALHHHEYWSYLTERQHEDFKKRSWL